MPLPNHDDRGTPAPASRRADWERLASPQAVYPVAWRLVPWFALAAILFAAGGFYAGFLAAPAETRQGEVYRIIYLHVPASWLSVFLYVVMTAWAVIGLVWNSRLSSMIATSLAPTGAVCAFLALWSGVIWGKPTLGTWWVWDPRLTVELMLMCIYLGFMALHGLVEDVRRADRASGLLALAGLVSAPIIYFSLQWWNTLHHGVSVSLRGAPSMATPMLAGLLMMVLAMWMYSWAMSLARLRCVILEREQKSEWVASAEAVF